MKSEIESAFIEEPPAVVLGELEVMTLSDEDLPRAASLLEEEHYLGAARPVGRTLVQAVHHQGRWVALLVWGPAALKLADRDADIGWTDSQRAERIGLILQNRRFLVLAKTRMPNLASRALSLAVNALPAAWEQVHGYRPLLAETFTDIEAFEGTCYKAAAWQPCGITKGFTREHRADYFFRNKRPKKLWLRVLHRNAGPMLRGIEMPPQYAAGLNLNSPERALPLRAKQLESLRDVLREVPDPRARNRKFPCSSLLLLVAMALLAGRKSLASIQRYGQFLTQKQRATLGWPSNKKGTFRPTPSYTALYNLLCKIDPHRFAAALNGWLADAHGTIPRGLAIDGKYVRNLVLTLCLSEHESGAPAAIAIAAQAPVSEENKKEGELTCARRLYATTPLQGATVTGDALNCEPESISLVVENGGDALFQLKANQPGALQHAIDVAAKHPPPFTCESDEQPAHGRKERRVYKVYAIEPLQVGLPHIRTLVVREKVVKKTAKKRFKVTAGKATAADAPDEVGRKEEKGEDPVSYFLGTRLPGPAELFARLIRGHWGGSEIRNHGTRDVQWEEDKTRSGNWALNASLAILRVALISVKFRQGISLSWPRIFEQCGHSTVSAISLINGKSIK